MADPRLKAGAPHATRHLASAGAVLVARQASAGSNTGSVPPWPGAIEPSFHATLAAIWIWARHQRLSRIEKFAAARQAAWTFLTEAAPHFVPAVIDGAAGDEAAFDCAMLLWAVAAEQPLGRLDGARQALAAHAARVLSAHLGALEDLSGREFRDPGFLVLAVLEYARTFDDRGLLAAGQKFVDRAFGMRPPGPVAREPEAAGGLFDFSSTTATRILAVMAAEGSTPFVGAWLRERIAATVPSGFTPRRLDQNAWNASVAWALGRAYAVSTDPVFLDAYTAILDELGRRDPDRDGAIGRDAAPAAAEVMPTFTYALAVDGLVAPGSV
ncbi:MAG TPA: hypothetical protein VHH90_05865 [Polyangia bacterium]|nr:hypothetical protein [Polyangia bacterium]